MSRELARGGHRQGRLTAIPAIKLEAKGEKSCSFYKKHYNSSISESSGTSSSKGGFIDV